MKQEGIIRLLDDHKSITNKMHLIAEEIGSIAQTKVGGIPWWPAGVDRPRCRHGHLMSFMAQIRLGDIPAMSCNSEELLSFHYCVECTYEGRMSFGWTDTENRGYLVKVFPKTTGVQSDGLGVLAEDVLRPHRILLSGIEEIPSADDMPEELSSALPDDFFNYTPPDHDEFSCLPNDQVFPGLIHVHSCKLGGFPSWVQNAERPSISDGVTMHFAGQLDWVIGESAAWGGGGYAYLFLKKGKDGVWQSELSILTT